MWTESVWEKPRQRSGFRVGFRGYDDLNVGCSAEFLEKLSAVATGCGGDGEGLEIWLIVEREICEEKLFGVDGVMKRETCEFDVDSDIDPTRL